MLAQPEGGNDAVGVEGGVGREGREGRVECLGAVRGGISRGGGAFTWGRVGFPRGQGIVLGGGVSVSLTGKHWAWGRGCLPFPQP